MGDARSNTRFQNSSRVEDVQTYHGAHPYDAPSNVYDMSKNRLMFIFNHDAFQATQHYNWKSPPQRNGTEKNVQTMTKTFGQLGFHVDIVNNLTRDGIMDKLEEICAMDHRSTSCLAITMLTHGDAGGRLYANDMKYLLSDVIDYVVREKSLAGKPKLFFVQACSGGNVDTGHLIQINGGEQTIPTHADCLVMVSSFDDHVSSEDSSGSLMIQALSEVLGEDMYQDLHILQMITLVNARVAAASSNQDSHRKTLIPDTKSTMTKYFKVS